MKSHSIIMMVATLVGFSTLGHASPWCHARFSSYEMQGSLDYQVTTYPGVGRSEGTTAFAWPVWLNVSAPSLTGVERAEVQVEKKMYHPETSELEYRTVDRYELQFDQGRRRFTGDLSSLPIEYRSGSAHGVGSTDVIVRIGNTSKAFHFYLAQYPGYCANPEAQ